MDKIQNSQSPGICNRLFKLIINTFWVTIGNQIRIESPPNSKNMNGDIEIEFRHLEIVGNKEKVPKKFVSIKEITQERSKTTQISAPTPTPARRRHFINVTSNINEKTEAFIKSKKEALRSSFSSRLSANRKATHLKGRLYRVTCEFT
ncbi:hypothetical protein RND71_020566 [Anisodus tanguticus]|uniref:Uncharacterized protein n=1 Tax=Anisodus tanguticus TaxID=243964 RepID=A0AAE1VHP8_9SOLA|nr:hypothetical protein RND71_020566 [Anisodus tanguticus]